VLGTEKGGCGAHAVDRGLGSRLMDGKPKFGATSVGSRWDGGNFVRCRVEATVEMSFG
jgi:hypothetical protein